MVLEGIWSLIIASLAPIASVIMTATLLEPLRRKLQSPKTRKIVGWGSLALCSIGVGTMLFFFPIWGVEGPSLQIGQQPKEKQNALIFEGKTLDYNPYGIVVYLERFSNSDEWLIVSPSSVFDRWPIDSNGSWTVRVPSSEKEKAKAVHFFLVREKYPAPTSIRSKEDVTYIAYKTWGIGE